MGLVSGFDKGWELVATIIFNRDRIAAMSGLIILKEPNGSALFAFNGKEGFLFFRIDNKVIIIVAWLAGGFINSRAYLAYE